MLAGELVTLAGGAIKLAERGHELMDSDSRRACHLVELAAQATPSEGAIHEIKAEVYQHRRTVETSLMSSGIFESASNESQDKLDND